MHRGYLRIKCVEAILLLGENHDEGGLNSPVTKCKNQVHPGKKYGSFSQLLQSTPNYPG